MFKLCRFKHLAITILLLCVLSIGSALAQEPVCTMTYDKTSYKAGETISVYYEIGFDGECTELYVEWNIITNWATGDIQPCDSFQKLTALKGNLSFTPTDGEGAVPYFTLIAANGSLHSFWGDPVQITGNNASEPTCSMTFDKDVYLPGDTIRAHYKIDFEGEFDTLYVEWCIIADWETGDIQYGDSFYEITALEGDLSFIPASGEGAIPYFTLIKPDGNWCSFWGDPVQIIKKAISEPTCSVSFDKDVYSLGETVLAHYNIDYNVTFSELYVEWNVITCWKTGDIQSDDNFHELVELEGDLSFTPSYGEGVILCFTLIATDGSQHYLWSDPVQITGSTVSEPTYSITFDKDVYSFTETVHAHYEIDYDGAFTELYAEWSIITDRETGDIQPTDSFQELTVMEGNLSFTPTYGEGIVLCFTLIGADGSQHMLWSNPVYIDITGITILPQMLVTIREEAFTGAKFTWIVCPESLLSIESRAFSDCSNLQCITIPSSVQSIAADAFEGCTSLTSIITSKGSVAEEYARFHNYKIIYQ